MRLSIRENPEYPETDEDSAPWRDFLRDLVLDIEPRRAQVEVTFLSDADIRAVNRDFRGRDNPTDVLSFHYGAAADGLAAPGDDPFGEILLSVETARVQAAAEGHSVAEELSVLVIHGLHHIMGMDHEDAADAAAMLAAELPWRERLAVWFASRIERS